MRPPRPTCTSNRSVVLTCPADVAGRIHSPAHPGGYTMAATAPVARPAARIEAAAGFTMGTRP